MASRRGSTCETGWSVAGLMTVALVAADRLQRHRGRLDAAARAIVRGAASAAAPSEAAPSAAAPSEAAPSEARRERRDPELRVPERRQGARGAPPGQDLRRHGPEAEPQGQGRHRRATTMSRRDPASAGQVPLGRQRSRPPSSTEPGCSATIIRIKGADEGKLTERFKSEAAKAGDHLHARSRSAARTSTRSNPAKFGYSYVKGDGAIIITADSARHADELVSALP